MKRLLSILVLTGIITLSSVSYSNAQVNVSVNIGSQPLWGPVGYDAVQYYYLPDLEMYYDVPTQQFVYLSNGRWVFATGLPPQYRNYDLYSGYKVVVNRPQPWLRFENDRAMYGRYKGVRGRQVVIRDSRDPRYDVVRGHAQNRNGNFRDRDYEKGRDYNQDQGRGHDNRNYGNRDEHRDDHRDDRGHRDRDRDRDRD